MNRTDRENRQDENRQDRTDRMEQTGRNRQDGTERREQKEGKAKIQGASSIDARF
jgi:hypothetical protein